MINGVLKLCQGRTLFSMNILKEKETSHYCNESVMLWVDLVLSPTGKPALHDMKTNCGCFACLENNFAEAPIHI